jgi:tryptophan synthase alpha chain
VNRIDALFARTRAENRAALIVFITAGDPDLATTAELIPELERAGADAIELGVPHSDPIGEGPTIQASSLRSLRHKTRPDQVIELVRRVRELTQVPLLLMGYLNNALAYGERRLAADCAAAGIDGLILADTPCEEAPELARACAESGVHRILLCAPTSTPERVVRIAGRGRGFIYCVSVTGVTGARTELARDLGELVNRIRRVSPTPVCVGFGISRPEHATEVARIADGVIVGSALVDRIGRAANPRDAIGSATELVRELARAVRGARSVGNPA